MAKQPRPWTVHRPGPLTAVCDGLWTVDDDVPGLDGARRRMTIARYADGALLFYNAVPVPDAEIAKIRSLGTPAHLVTPNVFHTLDAQSFAEKFGLRVWAPKVAVPKLSAKLACRPVEEMPLDTDMECFSVTGFKTEETVLRIRDTLITADFVTNAPHGPGLRGWIMRAIGFTGAEPRLPRPVRMRVETDSHKIGALLNELASRRNLRRLIPSHGNIFDGEVSAALRRIAARL